MAKENGPRHYVYRMDHDTGFAPHVSGEACTLCGCKSTTVERWAEQGSWVFGVGGNGTGRPDALIYAMEVEDTPSLNFLGRSDKSLAAYLIGRGIARNAPVLVSRRFYYFGDKAERLPRAFNHLIIRRQGCKRVNDSDALSISSYLAGRFLFGSHGRPNNWDHVVRSRCGCNRDCARTHKRLH